MPAKGKHRRPRNSRLSRGLAVAGTGGAALALPLTGTVTASAAPGAVTAPVAEAKPAAAAAPARTAQPVTYTVTAGDTLSGIAREHSVKGGWKKLHRDNRKAVGDDPSLIRPGLRLTVAAGAPAAGKPAAKRSAPVRADRSAPRAAAVPTAAKSYADDLDGWIRESLDVMARHGIPGTYEGIHRNIMRESSGNPLAINNWDSNAAAGTPSKGLLQVIAPTFAAYHVPGTSLDPFDPVANITAACNYAADRYGSIDNVNGPY
ncbi:LysM peptidoglycan-binding domain-containing protein [Streptomyces somaliensis]|uniref:transglycosylase SLT domain-containing protein n=1 Tax=Streptomyces somaliensis TaxID=78355 RepID=UPI0020CC857A|nr:LysM peptidoglycan-binding domain-containing protein [Streptomyces somaliensis]MCP9946773.1 LysM peptidoglycan-binding domain-containing protein [Streptomyces somaliensis]MCP9963650.1 LysM peptidoglycan-binding domain-containing protein [Streptomyces somaliensis]